MAKAINLDAGCGSVGQKNAQPTAGRVFEDYYFVGLGVLLAGYAIGGKLFAYIRVPPLYIGDVVLALGIIAFFKSRCAIASLATLPSVLLALLMGWACFRVLPYLNEYGLDALRDSAVIVYGGFAFVVAAMLLQRPERLLTTIPFLRVIGAIVVLAAPFLIMLHIRAWGGGDDTLVRFTPPSVLACHLTGAALLMLLGFRRASIGWIILVIIGIALVSTASRGAMFAILIPLAVASIASGKLRGLAIASAATAVLLGLAYALDLSISQDWGTRRDISTRQLVENFVSVFGASDVSGDLEGTRDWRLQWWTTILNYTFHGPYFWTGKGFGINLAIVDALVGATGAIDPSVPLNRAPHSCHFNILARTGVPGLTLWFLTVGTWYAMLLTNTVHARIRGDDAWARLFILVGCYALAIVIDGSFSSDLEGPMLGIWFWCLFGIGIGASMIYRASLVLTSRAPGLAREGG